MLFNSIVFLYAFLPVTCLGFVLLRGRRARFLWLTLASYVFYGWWDYRFVALLLFSTAGSYLAGLGLLRWQADGLARRLCVAVPVTVDLLLLGFFKYFGFGYATMQEASAWFGVGLPALAVHVILPVGISFYTFHTISYVVDSYRRVVTPTRDPLEFACYVSLFSQLVAGPIVRFAQVRDDLAHLERAAEPRQFDVAWSYFAIGMIKKVLIADSIALVINPALAHYQSLSSLETWLCALGYTYQLYFDFSGYSDMAVGLGRLFGIHIPQNFSSPYKAGSLRDFWTRWHMSLSSCLRDYLYIPLGGNRHGTLRTYRNLFLTMLIGGLWHGASWTFVAWGAYHGVLLAIERAMAPATFRIGAAVHRVATFGLVTVGWVLFRADNLPMARDLLRRMFLGAPASAAAMPGRLTLALLVAISAAVTHVLPNTFQIDHKWGAVGGVGLLLLFAVAVLVIGGAAPSPFLYYQF